MAEDYNVDNHPDNNISHLPVETPPDGSLAGEVGRIKLTQAARGNDGEMYAHKMLRQGEEARDIQSSFRK